MYPLITSSGQTCQTLTWLIYSYVGFFPTRNDTFDFPVMQNDKFIVLYIISTVKHVPYWHWPVYASERVSPFAVVKKTPENI